MFWCYINMWIKLNIRTVAVAGSVHVISFLFQKYWKHKVCYVSSMTSYLFILLFEFHDIISL